jgi:uncharacterized membrane protein
MASRIVSHAIRQAHLTGWALTKKRIVMSLGLYLLTWQFWLPLGHPADRVTSGPID